MIVKTTDLLYYLKNVPALFKVVDNVKVWEDLILYFDSNIGLQNFEPSVDAFVQVYRSKGDGDAAPLPFRHVIPIDLLKLHEQSGPVRPKLIRAITKYLPWQPDQQRRSTLWTCKEWNCLGNKGYRSLKENKCHYCGNAVEENIQGRIFGEVMLGRIICKDAFRESLGVHHSTVVRIKDESIWNKSWDLGLEHHFGGILTDGVLEVWATEQVLNPIEALILSPHGHTVPLPPKIADLYLLVRQTIPSSPWAFTGALVSELASDGVPKSSLLHLKYGLLLSLASQNRSSQPVPVVAVGADTYAAQRLLRSAGQLADRFVAAGGGVSLGGCLKLDTNNSLWEEQGDLSAASGGVCYLGDWTKYRRPPGLDIAVASVELGRVPILNSTGLDLPHIVLPLRAAVWTYWGHISSSARDQLQLRTLIDVFGMPFLSDETDELENEKLCTHILNDATEGSPITIDNDLDNNEIREYLQIANARNVSIGEPASNLIKSYFVACRRERPECLPVGAIKAISSLSEAHARLSLRDEVIPEDVVLVIYLYQEAVSTLFGRSPLFDYQRLIWDQEEPIHVFIHKQMQHFMIWLQSYLTELRT